MLVTLLVLMISGCSFALSQPDPLRAAHVAPRCDTGKGLVALDWVLAGVAATVALAALGEGETELGAVSALTSAAFIASAARGNGVVNECREDFAVYSQYTAPAPEPEVARRPRAPVKPREPRSFEDPYAVPGDLPARRIVAPPATAPGVPQSVPAAAPPVTPAKPAPPPAPAAADEWSEFWTEVP